ncbi:Trehalose-6-P synthase/phosphatase complex synthase subunit [Turnera subulata]|uniref:Trehalose-6-P synthase/phosphatase complex synthase subunit n=1 Tax=Turnera subulata TaxID=218843 RepID=A0A9Q0FNZ7_9ROSI|nr:Trehalose-6-P synthase/phosphatase complex synthase subunit [Turnera subulata]
MSVAIPSSDQNATTPAVNREWAEYHPTIWGDQFLQYSTDSKSTDDTSIQQQLEELKQEVRKMLTESTTEASTKLRLIDAVQRLGIGYHFTNEIEHELGKIAHDDDDLNGEINDLYTAALRFRSLRQQGIKVSSDTFKIFRDGEGRFKAPLTRDVAGLLSLYEAAHLAIRGEDILDQALDFATKNLCSLLPSLSPQLAQEVNLALNRPIRKCLPRLDARQYIDAYSRDEFHNTTLLAFAKLDFTILQRMHQKELSGISQWWKDLEVASRLPYARDRIVELYFWIMGVYFEPQYALGRKIVTKVIALLSILDDTYDNCGTCEELELLTESFQRWDVRMIDELPGYMKIIYGILIDLYNEIESDIGKEGMPPYATHYAKEAMKRLVRYYLAEARWRTRGYVPTMEEYMEISIVSTCYPMLTVTSFLGMGPLATEKAFEWASNDPKIVKASAIICRLMDDIVTHQFEQQRDHVASGIQCYMKQHSDLSEEEIVKLFREEIRNAWKDMNEECLKPTAVPMPLLQRVLNFARAMDVIYKDGDGYTNPHLLKDCVASLLQHPEF